MILEHGLDTVSAKWKEDHLDIGEKKKYRWTSKQTESDWFYDIQDALTWIINHDQSKH